MNCPSITRVTTFVLDTISISYKYLPAFIADVTAAVKLTDTTPEVGLLIAVTKEVEVEEV